VEANASFHNNSNKITRLSLQKKRTIHTFLAGKLYIQVAQREKGRQKERIRERGKMKE